MKLAIPFLSGIVLGLPSDIPNPISRITNGTVATQGTAPWAVLHYSYKPHGLGYDQCTGAILDRTTILTAAHCIQNVETGAITPAQSMVVGYNSVNQYEQQLVNVSRAIHHPQFNLETLENDIGILKLAWPLTLTEGYAEAIPIYDGFIPQHQAIQVSGWGVTDGIANTTTSQLLEGTVYAGNNTNCTTVNSNFENSNGEQVCIEYTYSPGVGTCYGDSGGSATIEVNGVSYAAGVVSYNSYTTPAPNQCGNPGDFSFYTHIYHYLHWIEMVAKNIYVTGPYGNGVLVRPPRSPLCLVFFCYD